MKTLQVCVIHKKVHGCVEGRQYRQCKKDCQGICDDNDGRQQYDFQQVPCPHYCQGRENK